MGSVAVIVDAKTLDARKFYESYGFIALADEPFRLFLPMRTISNLFGKA
jgi:hypothetical protein